VIDFDYTYLGSDHLWYLRQISRDADREALITTAESTRQISDSMLVFRAIKSHLLEHGSTENGKQTNESDAELETRVFKAGGIKD